MSIERSNTLITDPIKIANTFNDSFANTGTDSASNIIHVEMVRMKCINTIYIHSRNVLVNLRKYTEMYNEVVRAI